MLEAVALREPAICLPCYLVVRMMNGWGPSLEFGIRKRKRAASRCFQPNTRHWRDMLADVRQSMPELAERATAYRAAMRELRSPARIVMDFVTQASAFGAGRNPAA